MQNARKLANLRFALTVLAIATPVAVAGLANWAGLRGASMNAIVVGGFVLGGILFLWAMLLWRPRCPRCRNRRARFARRGDAQYLVCACGYEEYTGWRYGD